MATPARDIEPLANYHCACGENPLWDDRRKVVYWNDIPAGKIYCYDVRTGEHGLVYSGEVFGGFTMQADGSLLLFGANRVDRLDPDGRTALIADDIDDGMKRFNDVIADPAGRVYAGTMGTTEQSGGLFRVDTDGRIECLFRGTAISNGMAFTPDGRQFYWTCTTTRRIFRFDYDSGSGELTDRQVFLDLSDGPGVPDGMTVDAEGNVWSARWDGYGIFRYTPAGELIEKIEFPVAKVSSVVFGGEGLDELYVTTAGGSPDADRPDGTLYRVKVYATGLPEFRSRVAIP
ncbi:MAG: SMP-30/gluconolactonase/LRE family protein [Planctomycetota bacterium]|jgi:D-xylonolactonase